MITTNIYTVKKAIDKKLTDVDVSVMKARDEMMARLIQLSQEEIKGRRPKGQKATSGEPPMNRTGNLRRSITGKKAQEGFARYSAEVGPTMIYSRAVELGGAPTWHSAFPIYETSITEVPTRSNGYCQKISRLGRKAHGRVSTTSHT